MKTFRDLFVEADFDQDSVSNAHFYYHGTNFAASATIAQILLGVFFVSLPISILYVLSFFRVFRERQRPLQQPVGRIYTYSLLNDLSTMPKLRASAISVYHKRLPSFGISLVPLLLLCFVAVVPQILTHVSLLLLPKFVYFYKDSNFELIKYDFYDKYYQEGSQPSFYSQKFGVDLNNTVTLVDICDIVVCPRLGLRAIRSPDLTEENIGPQWRKGHDGSYWFNSTFWKTQASIDYEYYLPNNYSYSSVTSVNTYTPANDTFSFVSIQHEKTKETVSITNIYHQAQNGSGEAVVVRLTDYPITGVDGTNCTGVNTFEATTSSEVVLQLCNNHLNSGGFLQTYLTTVTILTYNISGLSPAFEESKEYFTYSDYISTDSNTIVDSVGDDYALGLLSVLVDNLTYILSNAILWMPGAPNHMTTGQVGLIAESYKVSMILMAFLILSALIALISFIKPHPDLMDRQRSDVVTYEPEGEEMTANPHAKSST